jgi:hypothetical protein
MVVGSQVATLSAVRSGCYATLSAVSSGTCGNCDSFAYQKPLNRQPTADSRLETKRCLIQAKTSYRQLTADS